MLGDLRLGWAWERGREPFLDVLGGGEQALVGNGKKASEAGVAVTMELLGVDKGTFDGLFSALGSCATTSPTNRRDFHLQIYSTRQTPVVRAPLGLCRPSRRRTTSRH